MYGFYIFYLIFVEHISTHFFLSYTKFKVEEETAFEVLKLCFLSK